MRKQQAQLRTVSGETGEAQIEAWRVDYNVHRPHSGLGNMSPAEWMKRVRNEDKEAQIVSV